MSPLIYGGSLCGAGGGGFMALIAKNQNLKKEIICLSQQFLPESTVYDSIIDEKGLEITINGTECQIPL